MKSEIKIGFLVFLVSCITITGLSFVDNLIIDRIIAGLGAAAFGIVHLLYQMGLIRGKQQGSDAFKFIFGSLLILVLLIYLGIRKLQEWISMWPLFVKILVPSVFGFLVILIVLSIVFSKKKANKCNSNNQNM